jgi:hypothetical protein
MILDSDTKASEHSEDHGDELRLWLRLLTCTTLIEGEVRRRETNQPHPEERPLGRVAKDDCIRPHDSRRAKTRSSP